MKKDNIANVINNISDEYVKEAITELYSVESGNTPMEEKRMKNKFVYRASAAVAACLILGVGTVAYAHGLFNASHREPNQGESYTITCIDGETGDNSDLVWDDVKYVMKFDGSEECNQIEFKENWVPYTPNEEWNTTTNADGYRNRLSGEGSEGDVGDLPPYLVEVYYAPQFVNDGAMLLNVMTPEAVTEEQNGEYKVLKFKGTSDVTAEDGIQGGHFEANYLVMFNEAKGYALVISGSSDMETLEHIANELDIRETGTIIKSSDFEDNVVMIDGGRG